MLFAALGVVAIAIGGGTGTFASFNAEVTNGGNYFQTGTLFLHDTANGVTCSSEAATDNKNTAGTGCQSIFQVDPTDAGASAATSYQVKLSNAGSLASTAIQFYGTCASNAVSSDSGARVDGTGSFGGSATSIPVQAGTLNVGLPSGTALTINGHSFTTSAPVNPGATSLPINSADTTVLAGGDAVDAAIQFSGGQDLCGGLGVEIGTANSTATSTANPSYTCKWGCSGDTKTLADLGSLSDTNMATLAGTAMNPSGDTYLLVTVTPPSNPDNSYQNEKADVSVTWHVDQA
ncbi:MAG TPA: SipW-dependent-type signal peptide-containing protein [Gaiellaceae bacterium]|nr:SipW-dependent-type signal peptide-containing protein [Gaiellaceae bacterium]